MSCVQLDESGYSEKSIEKDYFYDKKLQTSAQYYKGKIILYHGPYEAFNFIRHREGKLRTIKGLLENAGYFVEYVAWEHFNRMGVLVNDKLIFTCRMTELDYDGFGKNASANRAFRRTIQVLKRIEAWFLIKHFGNPAPHDYFSLSFGH
nr:uncharacterized protein LOC106687227 [Halyomorpha halys]XP_014286474.1 uncharacterized protein LOC106687227 [Halyomorpha halys]